jgi:hypothetical protein
LVLEHARLPERGRGYLERALSGRRSDPTTASLRARALVGASWVAGFQGDIGAAKTLVEEGLTLYRQLGDEEGIASPLTNLGMTAVLGQREDIPLRTVMEELGELKPHLENKTTLAYLLILEGMIALSQGDLEHSAALHEESLELFRETQDARGILSCLLHLGGIALAGGAPRRSRANHQITQELSISERTAENHVGRILEKLGLHSRAVIAAWVAQSKHSPHNWLKNVRGNPEGC